MRLDIEECRVRLGDERVARLATTGADMRPHLVPVTFALVGDQVVIGVDQKPKSTTNLRRLRNISENPRVAVLADHYEEDWQQLWWVRADGRARVVEGGPLWRTAMDRLRATYEQYETNPPKGPAIVIDIDSWSGWSAAAE